jgi:hypothetical protein
VKGKKRNQFNAHGRVVIRDKVSGAITVRYGTAQHSSREVNFQFCMSNK